MRLITLTSLALSCLAFTLNAQTTNSTNVVIRPLSLQESVRLALEHNPTIKIARHDPRLAGYALSGSYGYYEPGLNIQYLHNFSANDAGLSPSGTQIQPGEIHVDSLSSGIGGATPWGMTYDIGTDFNYQVSQRRLLTNIFNDRTYDVGAGIAMTQPLLRGFWINPERATIQVAKKDVKISQYAFAFQVMQILHDVEQMYFELIAARDNVKVQEKAVELADRLLAENKKKVEVGVMAPLEEKQAESQAATTRADLITARSTAAVAENALKNLITDHYEQWHPLRIQPTDRLLAMPEEFNLQASWLQGLTLRPDFNQLKEEVERKGIDVRLRHNQLFPTLDLVGSYGRDGFSRNFSPTLHDIREERLPRYSYGAVFSFPLGGNRAARYGLRTAKEEKAQLEDRMRLLHQTIMVEIDDAVQVAQSSLERVAATRAAREYAESALEAEQKKYENGRSTSFNVLRLQRDLTEAASDEINALAVYNKALSTLSFRQGSTLEKNRIVIK